MAINRVEINDFLLFKGEFAADFCPGINVFIGGNGTGKTTLMKVMYSVCDNSIWAYSNEIPVDRLKRGNSFIDYFYGGPLDLSSINISLYGQSSSIPNGKKCMIMYNERAFGYRYPTIDELKQMLSDKEIAESHFMWGYYGNYPSESNGLDSPYIKSVFIPMDEVLSHAKGFLALNNERKMPFDQTFIDVLSKAELPVTRKISPNVMNVLDKIKAIIGGEVVYESDMFYIIKDNGEKIPFSLEASGFRKFGLLWKLLRNGILEPGTVLFWDEPENSLNPGLVPVLVDVLLELSRNGVQVFIATHDYNLARYFDVRKNKEIPVQFNNLAKNTNGQIICHSSTEYIKIPSNLLEAASTELFKAVVGDAMEVQADE